MNYSLRVIFVPTWKFYDKKLVFYNPKRRKDVTEKLGFDKFIEKGQSKEKWKNIDNSNSK